MSGATILINKQDNTFTVVIEKDFHRWAGSPINKYTDVSLMSEGEKNLQWIKQELHDFLNSQWG